MPAQPPDFTLTLAVRDYECDLQGVVNNAVYQNYLEHARHQYLQSLGLRGRLKTMFILSESFE